MHLGKCNWCIMLLLTTRVPQPRACWYTVFVCAYLTHRDQSVLKHYLGTCPLPLPTAPETPWALNLPSQQSLGTCLEPLPPGSLSCSCNSQPQLSQITTCTGPCLPGRCSCSCNNIRDPHPQHPKDQRRFSVSGAGHPTIVHDPLTTQPPQVLNYTVET